MAFPKSNTRRIPPQTLRAASIVETAAVANRFWTEGTVSIQYFGFLRRDPDTPGYQNNVNTWNANPSNLRRMIFIYSTDTAAVSARRNSKGKQTR